MKLRVSLILVAILLLLAACAPPPQPAPATAASQPPRAAARYDCPCNRRADARAHGRPAAARGCPVPSRAERLADLYQRRGRLQHQVPRGLEPGRAPADRDDARRVPRRPGRHGRALLGDRLRRPLPAAGDDQDQPGRPARMLQRRREAASSAGTRSTRSCRPSPSAAARSRRTRSPPAETRCSRSSPP